MKWILDRLSEKSTWVAIVTNGAALLGTKLAPEMGDAIIATGLGLTSLYLAYVKEQK